MWALSFMANDQLVTGMENGNIKIWNVKTGEPVKALERQIGNIWSTDVSADGKYLVTACDDSAVTIWNLQTLKSELSFAQPTSTKVAVFSPDAAFFATGDRNSTVWVWDRVKQVPVELKGHRGDNSRARVQPGRCPPRQRPAPTAR